MYGEIKIYMYMHFMVNLVCVHVSVLAHMCVCASVCMCVWAHARMHVCMCKCITRYVTVCL